MYKKIVTKFLFGSRDDLVLLICIPVYRKCWINSVFKEIGYTNPTL